MQSGRENTVRVLFLIAILIATGILIYGQIPKRDPPPLRQVIPASGLAINDTKGKILGNPQNGIDDLKALYPIILRYKQKIGDACSERFGFDLHQDVLNNPQNYGLKDRSQAEEIFHNPDVPLSDIGHLTHAAPTPYILLCARPSGEKIGATKAPGTRDVLAYCMTYYFQNSRLFPHEVETHNPVGFYLVLWDDGSVDKVPYDKMLFTPAKGGHLTEGFPGQAGLSKGTLTYDQMFGKGGLVHGSQGKAK